jgi:hypothetical protein
MPINFQQAICAMKSLIQSEIDFVFDIASTARAGRGAAATAPAAPARLAKYIGEEVGIR